MKIENVIKKFNRKKIFLCPKCLSESYIENISLVCDDNHRYDFSKKGYIHLINNYKPTKYSEELFMARNEVFSNGFYTNVLKSIQNLVGKYAKDVVLDIGCGEGYYIKELKTVFPEKYFYGLDNSKDAIELAVKEDKLNPYMVANLANLPFKDGSVSCILNILTPANYEEFFRVLGDNGYLIKIIPNANYLREIRELIGGKEYTNSDTVKLIEDNCTVVDRITVNNTFKLTKEQAQNFLKMTPLTFSKVIAADDINKLKEITIDLELLVCKK